MFVVILLAALVAATAQAAVGVGFSLIAAPLLVTYAEPLTGVQALILLNLGISTSLAWPLRHHLPIASVVVVAMGAVVGLPVGALLAGSVSPETLKLLVGIVILAMVGVVPFTLRRRAVAAGPPADERPHYGSGRRAIDVTAGVLAGALTACVGMPGPALAGWAILVGLAKNATRAAILTLYVGLYGAALAAQAVVIGLRPESGRLALELLPAVLVGVIAGSRLAGRIDERLFRGIMILLVLGGALNLIVLALRDAP